MTAGNESASVEEERRRVRGYQDSLHGIPRMLLHPRQRAVVALGTVDRRSGFAQVGDRHRGLVLALTLLAGVVGPLVRGLRLRGRHAGLVDLVFVFFIAGGHVGELRLGGLDAVGILMGDGRGLDGLLLTLLGGRVAVWLFVAGGWRAHWVVRVVVGGAGVLGGWVHAVVEEKVESVREFWR